MNSMFHQENNFVVVYIDDILIFSKFKEENAKHFRVMLKKLNDNKLYANLKKSEFGFAKMEFLKHVLNEIGFRLMRKNSLQLYIALRLDTTILDG